MDPPKSLILTIANFFCDARAAIDMYYADDYWGNFIKFSKKLSLFYYEELPDLFSKKEYEEEIARTITSESYFLKLFSGVSDVDAYLQRFNAVLAKADDRVDRNLEYYAYSILCNHFSLEIYFNAPLEYYHLHNLKNDHFHKFPVRVGKNFDFKNSLLICHGRVWRFEVTPSDVLRPVVDSTCDISRLFTDLDMPAEAPPQAVDAVPVNKYPNVKNLYEIKLSLICDIRTEDSANFICKITLSAHEHDFSERMLDFNLLYSKEYGQISGMLITDNFVLLDIVFASTSDPHHIFTRNSWAEDYHDVLEANDTLFEQLIKSFHDLFTVTHRPREFLYSLLDRFYHEWLSNGSFDYFMSLTNNGFELILLLLGVAEQKFGKQPDVYNFL